MRVGPLEIAPPALLAPMAEITDLALRTVCEELGAGLTVTELLWAHALVSGARKTLGRLTASRAGRPFGVQIVGREVEPMVRAARLAAECGAALVDLNMGCPVKKVVWGGKGRGGAETCRGAGAALMLDPDHAARLVAAVRAALPDDVPVSVKHRAGWDERRRNASEFARRMADAGAAMITVHGRLRSQGFAGAVDLAVIREVRAAVPARVAVVGNGDVVDLASYRRMRRETGCDAVMIGRAAVANPWVFRDIRAHEEGRPPPGPPTPEERWRVFLRHVALLEEQEADPASAVRETRKALCRYARGLRGAARVRARAFEVEGRAELLDLAEGLLRAPRLEA